MNFLILSEAEATSVAGETAPGHELRPTPIRGGQFVLPETVLADPANVAVLAPMAGRTTRALDESEVLDAETDADALAAGMAIIAAAVGAKTGR